MGEALSASRMTLRAGPVAVMPCQNRRQCGDYRELRQSSPQRDDPRAFEKEPGGPQGLQENHR
jgi:hypothetical protein